MVETAPTQRETAPSAFQRTARTDLLARICLFGSAAVVFGLLAWGHLGLGAWLIPPATTPQTLSTVAGPYRVHLNVSSGIVTPNGPNTFTLTLRGADGLPLSNVTVHFTAQMTTMPMLAPPQTTTTDAYGNATLHPIFSMAGDWRCTLTLRSTMDASPQQIDWSTGVHWPGR